MILYGEECIMNKLPSKAELMDAIIRVFINSNTDILSTKEINEKVALLLNIPIELLTLEDANCTGTEYSYRMRWARTELKTKKQLINTKRGEWKYTPLPNSDIC